MDLMHKNQSTSSLRIIAGKWRRRRIEFATIAGVRPTADAIRETVFNWLGDSVVNASCLDLFAGSGALGFEALSRGAQIVDFIDSNKTVVEFIRRNANHFMISNYVSECMLIPGSAHKLKHKPYDIIFLDPPFHTKLLEQALQWIVDNKIVKEEGIIYYEVALADYAQLNPYQEYIVKSKKTKTIYYGLMRLPI